jgi:hypothetical protein
VLYGELVVDEEEKRRKEKRRWPAPVTASCLPSGWVRVCPDFKALESEDIIGRTLYHPISPCPKSQLCVNVGFHAAVEEE